MTTVTSFDSLDELRRAFRSLRSDEPAVTRWADAAPVRWVVARGERVVLVCGCGGSPGATTVALGLATVAGRARVVETCGGIESGLGFAAGAELGTVERQWLRGSRGQVIVERQSESADLPQRVPLPADCALPLTVVDSSWDVASLVGSPGWLGDLARTGTAVVLVARATVPGLRRLEAAVQVLGETRVVAVTVGAKRWPRPVEQSAGAAVRRLRDEYRIIDVPYEPTLAVSGLTPDPLPSAILRPARALLTLLEGPLS